MKTVHPISSFEKIKLLADSHRMNILRLLMASPATLTHLARTVKQSPAWVRHHMLTLESAGLVRVSEIRKTGKVTEKYYSANADAFFLREMILPKTKKPVVVFSGSHDLALEGAAEKLAKYLTLLNLPVGSLDGLVNLRQGICQISGSHLLDSGGEYNAPFVRHLFPERNVEMIILAYRTQGLMIPKGNPKGIKSVADFARKNVRIVNRNAGSGTRLWLDSELQSRNIPADRIKGYDDLIVKTHTEAASLLAQKKADAGIGLQAAADRHGLDFLPLFEERYDLILPKEYEAMLLPLLDYIQTKDFRAGAQSLSGYNTAHSGEQILL